MKHYVAYHNIENMGYSVRKGDESITEFDIVTKKRFSDLEGSVVWLISGEDTPRQYRLEYWFFVERIKALSRNPSFTFEISGTSGEDIKGVLLNDFPWFKRFQKNQANFSVGFNTIADEYVPEFCAVATSSGLPDPETRRASADQREEDSGPAARRKYVRDQRIRDSAVVTKVKRLYDYTCQVCGVRLQTPAGPYAQCAHIRPLGSPHNGPDDIGNVLCLCPNDHILFDTGSFSVRDDMTFIERKGSLRVVPEHEINLAHLAYHRNLPRSP